MTDHLQNKMYHDNFVNKRLFRMYDQSRVTDKKIIAIQACLYATGPLKDAHLYHPDELPKYSLPSSLVPVDCHQVIFISTTITSISVGLRMTIPISTVSVTSDFVQQIFTPAVPLALFQYYDLDVLT